MFHVSAEVDIFSNSVQEFCIITSVKPDMVIAVFGGVAPPPLLVFFKDDRSLTNSIFAPFDCDQLSSSTFHFIMRLCQRLHSQSNLFVAIQSSFVYRGNAWT